MSLQFKYRALAYKKCLKQRIKAIKNVAFKIKLTQPTAREFSDYLDGCYPGKTASNAARDIRYLINSGDKFDAEFTFLYFGIQCPFFVEKYSEGFIGELIRNCVSPDNVNEKLRALREVSRR